jgi:hypothetical protein
MSRLVMVPSKRCERDEIGLEEQDHARAEALRGAEGAAQRSAAPGHAVERHRDAFPERCLVRGHDGRDPRVADEVHAAVGGAAVGADEGDAGVAEPRGEAARGDLEHGRQRVRVVVGEERRRDLAGPDAADLIVERRGPRRR